MNLYAALKAALVVVLAGSMRVVARACLQQAWLSGSVVWLLVSCAGPGKFGTVLTPTGWCVDVGLVLKYLCKCYCSSCNAGEFRLHWLACFVLLLLASRRLPYLCGFVIAVLHAWLPGC